MSYFAEEFASKRSAHYNEFQKVQEMRAAGLLDSDEDEEEEEEANVRASEKKPDPP